MTNGYAVGQLGMAFFTATTHEDPAVRRRADRRAQRWAQAIEQIADGRVSVGSRAPVSGLPPWVTLEVLRGGFATGSAVAEAPLHADEIALAQRVGIPAQRRSIFGYLVTDAGLRELFNLLDSGTYRVEVPEDAALLTMAWLVRAGDRGGALDILDAVSPFADRLRLAPKAATAPTSPADVVYRITAGEAAAVLEARRPNRRVEAQREALAVWNPFGDRVLNLWSEKLVDGRVSVDDDPGWRARALDLLDEYERLAAAHTLCSKHRRPKENLAVLLNALRSVTSDEEPDPRVAGLLPRVIETSLLKRGAPGSVEHDTLRSDQRDVALAPPHSRLAAVAGGRLRSLDPSEGIAAPELFTGAVTRTEAAATGVAEGSAMPKVVQRTLSRAHAASVTTLLAEGAVPSSEVLAELVPRISATVVAEGFSDPALARLAAANYRAFRRRRSLLLLSLENQVQLSELPWVRPLASHSGTITNEAMSVAQRVAALALDHYPATIVPNRLLHEMQYLLRAAGHDLPLVEELAADIFMGRFSDKFRLAAQTAAHIVGGTIYARYYSIDPQQILSLTGPPKDKAVTGWRWRRSGPADPGPSFGELCRARAGQRPGDAWSVAANGMVIEQSQILTTHNLAAFVDLGIRPSRPWAELARDAMARTAALLGLAAHQRRPLATVKDAAYAWRQAVFYLSIAEPSAARSLLADDSTASGPAVMTELLAGLRRAADGHPTGADNHVPFLGWTVGRHWILDAIGHVEEPALSR